MYTDLLVRAQDSLLQDLDGNALVWYAIERRSEMLASGPVARASAMATLAVDVAYDCALLKLCAMEDIAALPTDFSSPAQGRRRFELELKSAGIDLTSAGWNRCQP